jgi:TRAP transporter TAXI family solute receptor
VTSRVLRALAVVLFTVGVCAAGCPADDEAVPPGPLRIATGSPGGVYFSYGRGIAEAVRTRVPNLRPEVLETAASFQNLQMVRTGAAEIGFAQADTAAQAILTGARVKALVRLYDDYLHLVVREEGPIAQLPDLRGKRVSIGAAGSGTAFTVGRLLGVVDLDPDTAIQARQFGLDDSAAALERGDIDAFFFSGGLPTGRVAELARKVNLRLVPIAQYTSDLNKFGQYYAEHTVPASIYGFVAVQTIGIPNYLVVSADMPAATAYALTRTLFDEQPALRRAHPVAARLNSREAIFTHPVELHEGAARYFREEKP